MSGAGARNLSSGSTVVVEPAQTESAENSTNNAVHIYTLIQSERVA